MPSLKPRDSASIASVRKRKARRKAELDELHRRITTNRKDIAKQLAQAPHDVRELAEDAPISVKDADTQFTGRDADVNRIARRVEGVIKQTSTGRNLTATAITGAPGVGKTTLLLHTIEELKKRKIEVLELNAEHLESDKTFSNAIQQATKGRLQAKLLGAKRIGKDLAVRTIDLGLNFAAQLAKAAALFQSGGVVDIEIPTIDIATQTYQAWQQRQVPDVFSVLQTIQYMYPDGVAIVVDEAQNLAKFQPSKNETTCAGHVIASLSTAAGRARAKMKKTTVLCAGLPDTIDVMSNLGSLGIHRHQLQPLPFESIRKVINGCIDEGAAGNKPLARLAKQLWASHLTNMYGDWTRHGAAAAQSAKLTLETWGEDALTSSWGWPALVTMADVTRDRVYDHVITEAKKHKVPE